MSSQGYPCRSVRISAKRLRDELLARLSVPKQMLNPMFEQSTERKRAVLEIATASWAMRNVKPRALCSSRSKSLFGQLVEVHNDPAIVQRHAIEHEREWGFVLLAIFHRSAEALQKIE